MNKLAFLSMAFLVGLCACGGPSETAKPPATPAANVDAKAVDPADARKPEAGDPEAKKGDTVQPGAVVRTNPSEKQACTSLKKDVCKITLGCAWSTKGTCVDH